MSQLIETSALPPRVREVVYWTYALVGVALGGTQVGYSAAEAAQPTWLIVALAVYAFVGAQVGATAATNVIRGTRQGITAEPTPGDVVESFE